LCNLKQTRIYIAQTPSNMIIPKRLAKSGLLIR